MILSRLFLFFLVVFFLFFNISLAEEVNLEKLGETIVHEGGRIKPLDSYARKILLILNGKSSFEGKPATEWLAKAMFTPEATLDDKVFKTTFKEVLFALGIEPDKGRRYSFNQLSRSGETLFNLAANALQKENEDRSAFEKEIVRLYQNYNIYREVLNTLVFVRPIDKFLIRNTKSQELLGVKGSIGDSNLLSYWDILEKSTLLKRLVDEFQAKPNLKAEEIVLIKLYEDFLAFPNSFLDHSLKFFPIPIKDEPTTDAPTVNETTTQARSYSTASYGSSSAEEASQGIGQQENKWFSSWEVLSVHQFIDNKNVIFKHLSLWNEMRDAYINQNPEAFNASVSEFNSFIKKEMEGDENLKGYIFRSKAELFYNKLDPFYRASIFYGLGLLLILVYLIISKPWLYKLANLSLLLGFALNFFGLIIRIIISHRPPITNLFETFVFVAFMATLLGIILEKFNKKGMGTLSATITGLLMLLISNNFISDGDTLAVLVAVLRSNFWLSTHVITINLGYAGIVLSGVIGHFYLIKLLSKNPEKSDLKNLIKMIYATQAFGIIFTFLGTMLGGIWADQSWGRFWGWDPKENGALLIVLWSAVIFHARFGGIVRDLGFAVGSIIGIPVVMLAWFGINLLGIGLHSYGFISGIAYSLAAYMLGQFLLLLILLYFIEKKKLKKSV